MTTINISDDYTITNYSASLGDNKVRDPANDVAAAVATCNFRVMATETFQVDGQTIILEDTNGVQKTYIFDDDDDGATGTVDGSGRIRVQVTGSGENHFGLQLRDAVHSANGHSGSLVITQGEFPTDFLITQRDAGNAGNTNVGGTIVSNSLFTNVGNGFNKFSGGVTQVIAFKNPDEIPHKLSIKGAPNLRVRLQLLAIRFFLEKKNHKTTYL